MRSARSRCAELLANPVTRWSVVIYGLVRYDQWCADNDVEGDSLSECIRLVGRTDTLAGRALFVGGWTTLTAWLIPHICRKARDQAFGADA